jgi:hypothetical protein
MGGSVGLGPFRQGSVLSIMGSFSRSINSLALASSANVAAFESHHATTNNTYMTFSTQHYRIIEGKTRNELLQVWNIRVVKLFKTNSTAMDSL